jgi:HlyD family secretion protein
MMWAPAAGLPQLKTAEVVRGDLTSSISATGTIEPEEVVDVGAQVAGKINNLGVDPRDSSKPIDYGAEVEVNTVLAQIDDTIYKTQVAEARASLARAEAELGQLHARVQQRQREWERIQNLSIRSAVTETQRDAAEAEVAVSNSALKVGEAVVEQSRAQLAQAEANLGYSTIRSPVRGTIIDRRVNIGQTVVASLNAPSLFLIAKDLRRLQVWAAVNEADVGQIRPGQRVTFTVDAFPGEVFEGQVLQTRLNATMTQNVVTYTVVVATDNSNGRLIPYLTANLQFETGRAEQALLVPNAALRWKPAAEMISPAYRQQVAEESGASKGTGTVWVPDGTLVRPVGVRIGIGDLSQSEVISDELEPGMQVVIGQREAQVEEETSNPFTPKMVSGTVRTP